MDGDRHHGGTATLAQPAGGFDRTPPQHLDAEVAVLGAALLSRTALAEVVEIVHPDDFYRSAHRTVFEAVLELFSRGEVVDPITVVDRLGRAERLDDVGGASAIHDLVASVPTAANAVHYARIVREKAILRRLIEAGTRVVGLGYEGHDDVNVAVDRAEQLIYDVAQRRVGSEYSTLKELLSEGFERIEQRYENRSEVTGLATGFDDLDRLTAGLQRQNLIIVAARPSVGKSTLCLNIAQYVAVELRRPVIVFSLEMSKGEIVDRILSAEARIDSFRIRNGRLDDADWASLSDAIGRLAEAPLFIDDSPAITLMEIRSKCRRLKQRHGLDLVVIDYLQLMQSHRRIENRQQEVSEISRGCKMLAKELDLPVIALSQLSRQPETRADKRPLLADLRESGCMPATTRLLRADTGAEVNLGELVLTKEQPLVWSLDANWRLVPRRLLKTFPSGIKPVFRLRLASGLHVDATANHRFRTLAGWSRLDELTAGTVVAVPRRIPSPVAGTSAWDDDELALLAHLLGDGSIGPNVRYATADPANRLVVEDTARRLFSIEARPVLSRDRAWQIRLPSPYPLTHGRWHPVRHWLEPMGLWGSRSHNTFIPEPIFGLSDDQVAYFLRHLWATDGSITINRNQRGQYVTVYYASTSRRLADGVRRLLLRLGIVARIRPARKTGYRDGWHVAVSGCEAVGRFLRLVGSHGRRGEVVDEALAIVAGQKPNPNVDLVPWPGADQVRRSLAEAGVSHRALASALGEQYCGSYLLRTASRPRRFSRSRLAAMADITGDAELNALARSDVFWDEVVEVAPLGNLPTFDATVEGTHNFIADGIVAHNSLEQDADVVSFIYRDEVYDPDSRDRGVAELLVAKHRNGPTGVVKLAFLDHITRFANLSRVGV
ncbi:MAG TPA: replicative DNA helicase [Nitriliruptorales bacterium]|nr:replicative DNA helicase [Nitriliruptorales bacterium]